MHIPRSFFESFQTDQLVLSEYRHKVVSYTYQKNKITLYISDVIEEEGRLFYITCESSRNMEHISKKLLKQISKCYSTHPSLRIKYTVEPFSIKTKWSLSYLSQLEELGINTPKSVDNAIERVRRKIARLNQDK